MVPRTASLRLAGSPLLHAGGAGGGKAAQSRNYLPLTRTRLLRRISTGRALVNDHAAII
jgi:hypothetical protein